MNPLPKLLMLVLLLTVAMPLSAAVAVMVDLSSRQLVVTDGNDVIGRYDVAIGKDEKPTPAGNFRIRKIVWNPAWHPPDEKWARDKDPKGPTDPDNPMKRVKIFFSEPDYYIHGTDDVDSLGRAESHGCVRMGPRDVTALAKLLMVAGGKPMPEPWYRRIFRSRQTKVIYLSNPIAMTVRQ